MARREGAMMALTLALLNVFVVTAALAVVKLTPNRSLTLVAPTVAARAVVTDATPAPTGMGATAPVPSPSALADLLAGPMRAASLGRNLTGTVADIASGRTLFDSRADAPATPASVTKLATSTAVLSSVGGDHRITTKVVISGADLVLVGGGDPTLTTAPTGAAFPHAATLSDLARQVAVSFKGRRVRVNYDASVFTGPRTGPGWDADDVSGGDAAPVSALAIDEGKTAPDMSDTGTRVPDPPQAALSAFVRQLKKYGVLASAGGPTTAMPDGQQIAAVESPPIADLVEHLLTVSDNDLAEAMARQVAIKAGRPASFQGAAQAVTQVLTGLGLIQGVSVNDGSGLSNYNKITPAALVRILIADSSAAHPELRTVITGMPIAGFTGTLDYRYSSGAAVQGRGTVRAKTGTLNGVNTLAGIVADSDGRLLAFAFMANKVSSPGAAINALDQIAGTLAGCGCR